jgi:Protein of unknown function (DUF2735)
MLKEIIEMDGNQRRSEAKIYQFPLKNSAIPRRAMLENRSATDRRLVEATTVEFGSGWYHEAAVQDERPRRP